MASGCRQASKQRTDIAIEIRIDIGANVMQTSISMFIGCLCSAGPVSFSPDRHSIAALRMRQSSQGAEGEQD
jgi:hypothetical protein